MNHFLSTLPQDANTQDWATFLASTLAHFDCQTGTLHRLDRSDGMLKLVVSQGVPEMLMGVINVIPVGKGIAGAAAERREPVELCNLQTDSSGVARADAKKTGVHGSIAVPIISADGALRGTLGIGKAVPHEFTTEEKAALTDLASSLAMRL